MSYKSRILASTSFDCSLVMYIIIKLAQHEFTTGFGRARIKSSVAYKIMGVSWRGGKLTKSERSRRMDETNV